MVRRAWVVVAIAAGAACKPDLSQSVSIVTTPRVLAVRADPAEVAPKDAVKYTALYADSSGAIAAAPIDWAFCEARKPLKELGPVSALCLQRDGDWFVPLGSGSAVAGTMPDVACRQFGPDAPQATANQPAGRPVDPDPTGGYYQPVRLVFAGGAGDEYAIGQSRIACGLAGATPEAAKDFADRYQRNVNPAVDSLTNADTGAMLATDDGHATNQIAAGTHITLRVAWAACPDAPAACTGAESYASLDRESQSIVVQREAMRVSWFATGGTFDLDHTGRDATDAATTSDDAWTAPSEAGTLRLWVVLRDDRGGVGWQAYAIEVK